MFCEKCGATVSAAARSCAACSAAVNQPTLGNTSPTPDSGPATMSDNVRKARLAQAMKQEVLAGGWIEAHGDFNAVIRFRPAGEPWAAPAVDLGHSRTQGLGKVVS
jgi:hypothetical protein